MVVYGDLLFLINFSMDFLCFYLTCLLLHKKLPTFRVCLASMMGGIYSVASLFIAQRIENPLLIDILALLVMCFVVFTKKGIGILRFSKYTLVYLFVSALLGGLMTALFNLFNKYDSFFEEKLIEEGIDVWAFSLLAIIGAICTMNGGRFFRSSTSKRDALIEIEGESGNVKLRALIDTGNLVHEPLSGKGVIFSSLGACKNALDEDTYKALLLYFDVNKMPECLSFGIRFVPSKMICGEVILPAIRFKSIRMKIGKKVKDIDVYVAFLKNDFIEGYDAIISSEIII